MRRAFAAAPAAILALCLGACAPSVPPGAGSGEGGAAFPHAASAAADRPARFQFIYVIHGEGSYGFSDADGVRKSADSEALARAREVALGSPDAEVFLFHQKPVRLLGALRIADGTMGHYRNGSLVRKENYRRTGDAFGLEAEAARFRKHAAGIGPEPPGGRVFLYFGHGVPEAGLPSFARGLALFAAAGADAGRRNIKPFSLVVLSSCNGGIPAAVNALAPHAIRILASPGELHLSYLDAGSLSRLSRNGVPHAVAALPGARGALAESWGRALAEASFAGLKKKTSTAVTVALYDADKAAAYLDARRSAWDQAAAPAAAAGSQGIPRQAYRDCSGNPAFGPGGSESGATVFFRPARFGPEKGRASHSGWECLLRESGLPSG